MVAAVLQYTPLQSPSLIHANDLIWNTNEMLLFLLFVLSLRCHAFEWYFGCGDGGGGNKRHASRTQCTYLPAYFLLLLLLLHTATNHRISVNTICVHWWRGVMNQPHNNLVISVISIAQKIFDFNLYFRSILLHFLFEWATFGNWRILYITLMNRMRRFTFINWKYRELLQCTVVWCAMPMQCHTHKL